MVDFQSRDTNRGVSSDDDDDDDAGEADAENGNPGGVESADDPADADSADADSADHESADHETADHEVHEHEAQEHGTGEPGSHEHEGHAHGHHHADVGSLGVAVVTVSSTRSREDDPSGDLIQRLVEEADHSVVERDVVADDLDGIQRAVLALTAREDVDVVITTGGTGVTPDDVTVEAIEPLFDKELPGFGELFRIRSYESVGTRALGSRATAGVSEGVPVFCLPGSEDAARLGTEELILAEMGHLVGLANRDE